MHEGYTFFSFFKILSDFSICCFFLDFVEIIRLELFGHHFVYQFWYKSIFLYLLLCPAISSTRATCCSWSACDARPPDINTKKVSCAGLLMDWYCYPFLHSGMECNWMIAAVFFFISVSLLDSNLHKKLNMNLVRFFIRCLSYWIVIHNWTYRK